MKGLFRALAAAFKKAAPAQAVAGVLLLALSLYTGYQLPRPTMIGALRWISYINVNFETLLLRRLGISQIYENSSLSDTVLKDSWPMNSIL